jgi:hypothetical protein
MLYYQYFKYFIRCIGANAGSLVDVGSGNAPYLEWFDWIPRRVSVDLETPYRSDTVQGVAGDIRSLQFDEVFDICTCMQVLEHVPEPEPFARRLLELGRVMLVSVPYKWPKGSNPDHVNDPVDLDALVRWFGRKPNYHLVVREPFVGRKGVRLFAIFDVENPQRTFGTAERKARRPDRPRRKAGSARPRRSRSDP